MRSAFTGAFAPYICGLIEKKQALGYDYHGSACILRTFDEFCREQFPNETCLTAELAMKWAEQFKTEKNLSRLNRVSVIRELAKYMNTVVAAAITSRKAKNSLPTHILLENVPGLAPTSLLLLEQLRTIDRKRLRGYIGRISKEKMLEVDAALAISIGIGYPNERRTHNV